MYDFTDYYKTLQVHHEATQDIIHAAYRCFSKLYHPDVNTDRHAADAMARINIAYDVIGNPNKRESYHREWVARNGFPVSARDIPPSPYERAQKKKQTAASLILKRFFDCHLQERWEESYQLLTEVDHRNIPLEEYLEWRKAVSSMFRLMEYEVKYIDVHREGEYGGTAYTDILHFSIDLTEMDLATGRQHREHTTKYVAFDGTRWRVCLGYSELKTSIRRLHYLAKALPKPTREEIINQALSRIDPLTGLYSRSGLIEEMRQEQKRSNRYGNPLSFAVLEVVPTDESKEMFQVHREVLIAEIGDMLSLNLRETDIVGRIDDAAFGLLFVETESHSADTPLHRLVRILYEDKEPLFDLHHAHTTPEEESAEEWIERTQKALIKISRTAIKSGEAKLGKYHLSDILEFNKKKRTYI